MTVASRRACGGRSRVPRRAGRRLVWVGAFALALSGRAMLAAQASAPPLAESVCQAGGLVDAEFRDAALAALDRLVVRAPGSNADGAVLTHESPGFIDARGRAWRQVSAYAVNLGLIGALRVAPALLPVVGDWLRWQARHQAASGVVLDHWLLDRRESTGPDAIEVSTCPAGAPECDHVDAFDSTAATMLLLADAYRRHGGSPGLLREPAVRRSLEASAAVLKRLARPDGLTIAKPDHPAVYAMDQVEVAAGWRAWARLQRDVLAAPREAARAFATAARIEASLVARLWDGDAGAWRVSLEAGHPEFARWYPDTVAQAWPRLWSGRPLAARSRRAWARASAPWQGGATEWSRASVDPNGFSWPAIAVAARCSGDDARAAAWVGRARERWMAPAAPFAWPFQISDLLWLFWMAEPMPLRAAALPAAAFPAAAFPAAAFPAAAFPAVRQPLAPFPPRTESDRP